MSCLHVRNLSVYFPTESGTVTAVDDVSFDHIGGETLTLMGETGCGKSVIANSIMRLLPDNAEIKGQIIFKEMDLLRADEKTLNGIRGQDISMVFQNPGLALNPIHSVGKQIEEPLLVHRKVKKKEAQNHVKDVLRVLGFKDIDLRVRSYPFQFSGGMNQRVVIAASMVLSPRVLITDEPTKGLDETLRTEIMTELMTIKKRNQSSLLLITHDFDLAKEVSDRVAIMYAGEIIESSPVHNFFNGPLHPYSKALLMSLPENGFQPIPGPSVDMTARPLGCRFHPRCSAKERRCEEERPPSYAVNGREVRCFLYS